MQELNELSILLVDDTKDNIEVLRQILKPFYSRIIVAKSGERAIEICNKRVPDLILLDIVMPEMDGYDVCQSLKALPDTKNVPIIFITAKSEPGDLIKGFKLGAADYITKPFNAEEVLARVHAHLSTRLLEKQQQALIAELTDKEEKYRTLFESSNDAIVLLKEGRFIDGNQRTLDMFAVTRAQLLSLGPADVSPELQPDGSCSQAAAIEKVKRALEFGSARFDWYHKKSNGTEFPCEIVLTAFEVAGEPLVQGIVRDITERKRLENQLTRWATTDQLSGAFNRRYFFEKAKEEVMRAGRYQRDLCLLLIDIDFFKRINDTHGHAAGDVVIQKIVEVSQRALRTYDTFARMGGEEFAVLLPETHIARARIIAERIRELIQSSAMSWEGSQVAFTASIGVTHWHLDEQDITKALLRADRALYAAKDAGRNKVMSNM